MRTGWLNKRWVIVLLHTVGWIVIFSFPFLLRTTYKNVHRAPQIDDTAMLYFYFFSSALWVILFYINALSFIPLYVRNKKVWQLIGLHLVALAIIYCFHFAYFKLYVVQIQFIPENFFVYNLFPYLFSLASSTAYYMFLERQHNAKLAHLKETENLKSELLFLRSQVSPHFMFNVLNNMVALARKKSDLLEPSLIKLSSLMRYMLYETDEQKVPLEKEIEYVQSYIDLQKQRYGKNVIINTCFQDINYSYEIEPMLLIPFVENAFKHGTGIFGGSEISIALKVNNGLLNFTVSNKYTSSSSTEIKDKDSGIGLNNVQRRLNLLYGKSHVLSIDKSDGVFTVFLQLNLH